MDFAEGDTVVGKRLQTGVEIRGKFVRQFGVTGAVVDTDDGVRVVLDAKPFTPGDEWLSGERPPVPDQESTPLYDEISERLALAAGANVPEWPVEQEFARATPAGLWCRFNRLVKSVRWSGLRVAYGALSALAFVLTGAGALWQVIR